MWWRSVSTLVHLLRQQLQKHGPNHLQQIERLKKESDWEIVRSPLEFIDGHLRCVGDKEHLS
jgi:hypothetical protein